MKTCPVCALDLDDTYLFCPDDGSSVGTLPILSSKSESATAQPDDESPGAVVLYCPACAAEYPLTFSACPVHHMLLTKHPIPSLSNRGSALRDDDRTADAQATLDGLRFQRHPSIPAKQLTTLELKRPAIESPKGTLTTVTVDRELSENALVSETPVGSIATESIETFDGGITPFDYRETLSDVHERRMERSGFRVAAIATVIALALFGVVAMYKVGSNLSRRSSSNAVQIASKTEPTPRLTFVPTPQEAQNYKETSTLQTPPTPPEPQPERPVERLRNQNPSSSTTERGARKTPLAQPPPKPPVTTPPPAPAMTPRTSNAPLPALPRGNAGEFDARLIRVRSMKTAAGFRYDLTFNMQEQAGRSAHWQRVLISTRSASGMSHSEAIPFSHRLGASGALTFTISVELTGRSEADWQGRIVCTTLGWDNAGAPLQASFGANVTP